MNHIIESLTIFDEMASRLVTKKHTSVIKKEQITELGLCLRHTLFARFQLTVSGGVFSGDSDNLWMLSAGSDVQLQGFKQDAPSTITDTDSIIHVINETIHQLQDLVYPKSYRFNVEEASWCPGQMTVKAMTAIPAGEVIGEYQGYYCSSSAPSNERYNATVGGSSGLTTVDPCLGYDSPLPEWSNAVTHRINEPPIGLETNCMWKVRKGKGPEILAARYISPGEELFLFYGAGHAPLRDYPIADDLAWTETHDSYNSD